MELLIKTKDIWHHTQDPKSRLTIDCKITSKKHSASRIHRIVNRIFPNEIAFSSILLLCFCLLQCVHCLIVEKPLNEAKRIGDRVIMKCASDSTDDVCGGLSWELYEAGNNGHPNGLPHTNGHVDVVQEGTMSSLVSDYISLINSSRGNCSLEIKAIPKAAGKYKCVSIETNEVASAELIVLDGPECSEKTGTTEFNNVTCSVRFNGNVAPTMEWIQVIGQSCSRINSSVSSFRNKTVENSILLPVINASNDETCWFSGYTCIAKFSDNENHWNDSGKNIPNFQWTSVIYGVGKMEEPNEPTLPPPAGNEVSVAAFVAVTAFFVVTLIVSFALAFALCQTRRGSKSNTRCQTPEAADL